MNERKAILELLHKEVVPALGCTEPVAVALAAARATEALGQQPEFLEVAVSPNLLKNGMGVMVPGTGELGLGVAAAAGCVGGQSQLGLECLRDLTPEQAERAKEMLAQDKVRLVLPDNDILLYCKVTAKRGTHTAAAELRDSHANLTRVWKDGELICDNVKEAQAASDSGEPWALTFKKIYDFATTEPLENIDFILETARMNRAVAEEGMRKEYGLAVGKAMDEQIRQKILSDDVATFAVKFTAAATDARMAGVQMPVMSNSGSGNQGLACTVPVVAYAMRLAKTDAELVRALILSHLMSIHIKHHLGRLSALCGVIVAATAAACGITYLLGGGEKQIENTVHNMVGNISGMICDGAKSSCALKVASAVGAGIQASMLALRGKAVTGNEGIVADDIESCIANLGRLGSSGMKETDKVILDIMLKKQ